MDRQIIFNKVRVLKHMLIWDKMTKEEKVAMLECKDENYADRLKRSYQNKYLN